MQREVKISTRQVLLSKQQKEPWSRASAHCLIKQLPESKPTWASFPAIKSKFQSAENGRQPVPISAGAGGSAGKRVHLRTNLSESPRNSRHQRSIAGRKRDGYKQRHKSNDSTIFCDTLTTFVFHESIQNFAAPTLLPQSSAQTPRTTSRLQIKCRERRRSGSFSIVTLKPANHRESLHASRALSYGVYSKSRLKKEFTN